MATRGANILGHVTGIAFALFCVLGMFPRCANTAAPLGGPKDSLPPVVVRMTPEDRTVNFTGRRIYVEFDEYVQLKDLQKEFYVSPATKRTPTVTVRGRGIQIDINPQDTLLENTTYAFNFGSAVADNNEGNSLNGFRYVMSTGPEIDSLVMSGYAVDAYKKDSVAKAFIFFFDASKDSIPEYDSTIFNSTPDVIGRAEANGIFFTQNLKPIPYRVYAVGDKNGNKTYDPGTDMVGFLDGTFNPEQMPEFSIWYDTMRRYMVADPQLYFRMFTDDVFERQYLSGFSRPVQHQLVMVFGAPNPQIESLRLDGIDSSRIIVEYLRPDRDSIALWLNVPSEELPDTIKGELTFMRHDSLRRLERATVPLAASWRAYESNEQRRERERLEREREKLIAEGQEVPKEPNPFKYSVDAANPLNPEKGISMTFEYPLASIDSSRISLVRIDENEAMYRVPFSMQQDSLNIRKWTIKAPWISGQNYDLEIPDSVFTDILGHANDTLRSKFAVMSPDKYGTIVMKITGKSDTSKYVLQLIDNNRGNVLQEIKNATTGEYRFLYISPGTVRIRVVEDLNGNGQWDKGNLIERIQPERVEIYSDPGTGESDIEIKVNWEQTPSIDMNEMFAPITMESVMRELEKKEQLRLQKYFERLEEQQRRQQGTQERQQQGNTFNPTEGFGI